MWPDITHIPSWNLREILFGFAFYYPLFMAWIWMIGGTWFYIRRERRKGLGPDNPDPLDVSPPCSILVPCFNEQDNVRDTIEYALASHYPNFEVIAINDGSSDHTADILDEMAVRHDNLRVIHLASNQGKAIALRTGALASDNEFLICIDGDALIHPYAVHWMMAHFNEGPRVGAVTGNPRIINRSSLLGKVQVGEFSSIIGLIKRAQRTYGRIFTVSGVIAAFRKSALQRVGYWQEDMVTDDIDVSWRLQMDHWDIRYEPEALCYIYMPETLHGLWRQRLRWAQGGVEVLMRYGRKLPTWRHRRFWGVALEYMTSVTWSYVMLLIFVLYFLGKFMPLPPEWSVDTLLPEWNGTILGVTCLAQFLLSLWIDRRYEHGRFIRNYFWVIWYPLLYWILSMLTAVVSLPKTLLRRRKRARWVSPDRGLRPD